jgi:hypothetical protein
MKRFGWDEPTEVPPRRWRWGHGGVDVFSFSYGNVLGPSPHLLDDVGRGSDAASIGGCSFAEDVRCPFDTGRWSGSDGGVGVDKLGGKRCNRLPVFRILVR